MSAIDEMLCAMAELTIVPTLTFASSPLFKGDTLWQTKHEAETLVFGHPDTWAQYLQLFPETASPTPDGIAMNGVVIRPLGTDEESRRILRICVAQIWGLDPDDVKMITP